MSVASNIKVIAVVVTYNRKKLLLKCLSYLKTQKFCPYLILVLDNASTDGTKEALLEDGCLKSELIFYHRLNDNTGGAGGFSHGLELALTKGADWVWMMDDDAMPHSDALFELMRVAKDPDNIYGSTPILGKQLSWGVMVTANDGSKRYFDNTADMPCKAEVEFLPFLGILIHKEMVKKIGLPDPGFFIAADDVEYTVRAKRIGAKLIQVGKSRIEHPPAKRYQISVFGHTIYCLKLSPWKRYYDTRNRLLLAKKHYGKRLYSETIPGSFVRMFGTLLYEPQKGLQLWAFVAGFIDGLLERKGKRHSFWGIPF